LTFAGSPLPKDWEATLTSPGLVELAADPLPPPPEAVAGVDAPEFEDGVMVTHWSTVVTPSPSSDTLTSPGLVDVSGFCI
jgi:hypothetical protein